MSLNYKSDYYSIDSDGFFQVGFRDVEMDNQNIGWHNLYLVNFEIEIYYFFQSFLFNGN